jgi:hypothetical protein
MKSRNTRRQSRRIAPIVESLESRTLLSTSSATLTLGQTGPLILPGQTTTGAVLTLATGAGGTTDLSGSYTLINRGYLGGAAGAVTIGVLNNSGSITVSSGTLILNDSAFATIAPIVTLQSTGPATTSQPPTLTVQVTPPLFTSTGYIPITYDTVDGTVTKYISGTLTVPPGATLTVPGAISTPIVGTPTSLTAPTGTILLLDGATVVASCSLVNGQATFQPTLAPGLHSLQAVYSGDTVYAQSTSSTISQIIRIPTAVQLAASATTLALGDPLTLNVTAATDAGLSPDGQTIALYDGLTRVATSTITNGAATFTWIPPAAGAHSLHASLLQNDTYDASTSSTINLTVNTGATALQLDVTQSLGAIRLQAVASGPASFPPAPTGTINFYDNGTFLRSVTLGSASDLNLKLGAGIHHLSAQYAGDANFQSASATANLTIPSFTLIRPTPKVSTFIPNPTHISAIPAVPINPFIPRRFASMGAIQSLTANRISGWALDRDSLASHLRVLVYIDGKLVAGAIASNIRPGLWAPFRSAAHGFDIALPTLATGTHHITLFANDPSNGRLTVLAARTLRMTH